MNRPSTITMLLKKKIATILLVSASVAAFATLGDGEKKGKKDNSSVLMPYNAKNFSLRSHFNFKSNNLFSTPEKKEFIMLNPVVTYQKGNATYVLPLKKMPLLGKIRVNLAPQKF